MTMVESPEFATVSGRRALLSLPFLMKCSLRTPMIFVLMEIAWRQHRRQDRNFRLDLNTHQPVDDAAATKSCR